MSSAAYSFEHFLASTIGAALYDADLERSGKKIVYFFDADVVAGSLFAREKIEEDIDREIPFTRSVVRALWLQGQLPCVRLTIPHLHELKAVLRSIEESGGIAGYLGQHHDEISRKYGLASRSYARERLVRLFNTMRSRRGDDEDQLTDIIDNLGIEEFAIIEAELAANVFYEKDLLKDQIDLNGDLGESEKHIEAEDHRFKRVVEELNLERPTRRPANRSDAASLLAIARLWARDYKTGVEYRFYTHTDVVRIFCEKPLGKQLMTKPGSELPISEPCTDSSLSAVRGSTYFILRSAFPSVSFQPSEDNSDLRQERLMLKEAATSLLKSTGELTEHSMASLRIAEQASSITLGDLLLNLRNRKFTTQMLTTRRDRVYESLNKLSRRIQGMGDLRARLMRHESTVKDMLVKDAARFGRSISSTVIARGIHRRLLRVDIPSEEECALSIDRWNPVFSSDNARENAIAGLRQLCHPVQAVETSWVNVALDTLGSSESVDDALAVIVPLLTLGEFEMPLKFFDQCEEPRTASSSVSFHALRTWALSMAPTPAVELLIESWAKLNIKFNNLENTAPPTGTGSGRCNRRLMAAWVAVYVSSCLRNLASDFSSTTDFPHVAETGKKWADGVLRTWQSSDPLCDMAWAAKLILLANEAWCSGDVRELRTARNECSPAVENEPSLYLVNAQYWATFVEWREGAPKEQILLGPELAEMQLVAFERFQVAVKDAIRAES